jgi:hypothetical protein
LFRREPTPSGAEYDGIGDPKTRFLFLLTSGSPGAGGLPHRMDMVLEALGHPAPRDNEALLGALEAAVDPFRTDQLWLAIAVVTGTLPNDEEVVRARRIARLDGVLAALWDALERHEPAGSMAWPDVEVVTGSVLVDVHHTAGTELATGIQRVARETVSRWNRDHDVILTGWTDGYCGLRRLEGEEVDRLLGGRGPSVDPEQPLRFLEAGDGVETTPRREVTIVPWRCSVLVPELAAEPDRAGRYQALAAHSGCRTGVIGFDCVPLMASETSAEGMTGAFARHLAAAAHFDRLAAISDAAALEYGAWRSMLPGSGREGPQVKAIPLAVEPRVVSDAALRAAGDLLTIGHLPVVLAVGSHEPRKNHLAVLQAAEVLWRDGLQFSLTFVGGNSWKSDAFTAQVRALQARNRPLQTILGLSDELLWAAYRVAYCTVFVSVHEGYGLPVAESLASGTPVVTSDIGSMLALACQGGALTVDPRDDDAITHAVGRLVRSPALRHRLAEEASRRPWRTWDEYAQATWEFLLGNSADE